MIEFQSPSLRGSGRFQQHTAEQQHQHTVSIPFIAGQWSLPPAAPPSAAAQRFQSPSLRGSGRFPSPPCGCDGAAERVSIPFIAGQWSLPAKNVDETTLVRAFQSPSLRGSGRFEARACLAAIRATRFNPLHCGAVVASLGGNSCRDGAADRFNPLHCGAVVASISSVAPPQGGSMFQSPSLRGSGRFAETRRPGRRRGTIVSIPFIAGQWSLPSRRRHARRMAGVFQSPSLRGSGRFG